MLGHRLYVGALAGVAVAVVLGVPLLVRLIGGQRDSARVFEAWLAAILLPVLLGLVTGGLGGQRAGVDADDGGMRQVPPASGGFWPWPEIVDIREQRRGGRTVVAIDLSGGLELPLPAPYDGRLLGRDADFEHKYFTLRSMWETYRRGPSPGAEERASVRPVG